MTLRRVVALAQAWTMIMLLLPGPPLIGPAVVEAALRPAEPEVTTVVDAEGKGIGCRAGSRKYKGPKLLKDPPWPPGAEPTPSPEPSREPDADTSPSAEVSTEPTPEPEAVVMAFAAGELAPVQAELTATSELITGIDVSWHKGDIDFEKVREAGHRFAIIKATENNDFIDKNYETNRARADAAGLAVGAYHVFDYTLSGKAQADHFVDRLEAVGGIDGSLPPVVDVECWNYYGPSIQAIAAARLRDLVERIYERTGLTPMIYTSARAWNEVVGDAEGFEELSLWTASWFHTQPTTPSGWDAWTFWQVSNKWRVPGIKGNVDGNYFSGSRKELRALKTAPVAIETGAVASAGGTVEFDLGGRTGTHYRTSADGEDWSDWQRLRSRPTAVIPESVGTHTVFLQLKNGPGLKSPVFSDSIVVDDTPPELTQPSIRLRTGVLGADGVSVPVTVAWDARDETAGLADAHVLVACDDGQQQRYEAPGQAEPGELSPWQATAWLVPDRSCEVTAVAADGAGNTAQATIADVIAQGVGNVAADGGPATATLGGSQAGVVARRGPDGGRAALDLDGEPVALVDLYAPEAAGPEIVHVLDLPAGEHTLTLEPIGSSDPSSNGTVVAVEGFVSLDS
jgi:lysozyme